MQRGSSARTLFAGRGRTGLEAGGHRALRFGAEAALSRAVFCGIAWRSLGSENPGPSDAAGARWNLRRSDFAESLRRSGNFLD